MRSSASLSACLLLLGLISGCSDSSSGPEEPSSFVSIQTPSGWQRKDDYPIGPGVSADYVLYGPPVSEFSPNIIVLTGTESDISIDSAVQLSIASLKSQSPSCSIDSNIARPLSRNPARLLQISWTSSKGDSIVSRQFFAKKSGMDIQIVFTRLVYDKASIAPMAAAEASIRF